ncbi:MAG: ATP-binding protein [Opitutaceae bacterium]
MSTISSVAPFANAAELPATTSAPRQTVTDLFNVYERKVFTQANRLFWWLLISQWAFAILVAAIWSPRTWAGTESRVHPHLIAAIFLGGALVSLPLALMRWMPFHPLTRHTVAVAQVSFSALLIHLTGGRIETHFHVFGSLAFLAVYRDWRVLPTATVMVALDHLLRGLWFPESVYGVPYATLWRTAEHAGWVIFENVVLVWACLLSRREMWEICQRQDAYQQLLDGLEERVRERTQALRLEVTERVRTANELNSAEERYRTLVANLPIGVFKITRGGEVRLANPYLLKLLGIPEDTDLAPINTAEGGIFPSIERERFWARLRAEREVRGFETNFRKVDGTRVDVVINARWREEDDGRPACEGTLEDVTARKRAADEVEKLHQQLVTASRQAGMAEVATGVLHNVGNVLTSVNVTIHDVLDRLRSSRLSHLRRVVEMLQREQTQLGTFLTTDSKGRQLPDFLAKLETHLADENKLLRTDVEGLVRHFEHIRQIIVTQQNSAKLFGATEDLPPAQLAEDAVKLIASSLDRHAITLDRNYANTPVVRADRHKVLQILVNLMKNAKDALLTSGTPLGRIVVRVQPFDEKRVALSVSDNGPGIPAENLAKIFQHGFTTKKDGHGFGLHSAVLAAREMGGDLEVASEGTGRGSSFTLTLPLTAPTPP